MRDLYKSVNAIPGVPEKMSATCNTFDKLIVGANKQRQNDLNKHHTVWLEAFMADQVVFKH